MKASVHKTTTRRKKTNLKKNQKKIKRSFQVKVLKYSIKKN